MKKTLWIVLIAFIAVLVYYFSLGFRFFSKVHTSPSGKISDGIYCLQTDYVDSYIFTDGTNYIIVDSGYSAEKTTASLKEIGISGDSIKSVFLTHSDYDHAGGIAAFPNADIYLGAQEAEVMSGKIVRMLGFFRNKPINKEYRTLEDGQVINIGGIRITAIWTPGHTPGSFSYLVNGNAIATGDTLMLVSGKLVPTPNPPTMDLETEKKSIQKLSRYSNVSLILTAHTGVVENGGNLLQK